MGRKFSEVEKLRLLDNALGTGQIIRIKYHGGTNPGMERDITPVYYNESRPHLIDCYCAVAGDIRSFNLEKIEIVDDSIPKTHIPTQKDYAREIVKSREKLKKIKSANHQKKRINRLKRAKFKLNHPTLYKFLLVLFWVTIITYLILIPPLVIIGVAIYIIRNLTYLKARHRLYKRSKNK